ncbi:MAG TPA: LPS export ABC transporter permease LptF [Alphaproteobacteria bacterium]|nr:LPS export ABC transporter permease LptF [Alphaproteobacteria bacterium]
MINKIDRYLLRLFIVPLAMALAIAAMLLLLERMLRLFDLVINQGGPVGVVWQLLGNLVPHYVGLALPLGVFLGVLLAFQRLSMTSELDALMSTGFGIPRLIAPALALAFALMILNLILAFWVQPYSRYAYRELLFDLRSGALGASIKTGEFNKLGDGFALRIGESHDGGQRLVNLFAQKRHHNGAVTAMSAEQGSFLRTNDENTILLRLKDGEIISSDTAGTTPVVLKFDTYDWPIKLPLVEKFRARGGANLELTLPELWRALKHPPQGEPVSLYEADFHDRIIRSLSILVLPFLAVPFGVVSKRSGRGFGLVIGVILVLTYHKVEQFAQAYVSLGNVSPWIGIWIPFLLFSALSGYLYYLRAYKVGGGVLLRLEDVSSNIMSGLRSILPKRKRHA